MAEGDEHRVIQAAGAVIWRQGAAGLEVALAHRPRYDDWSHPKGKRQPGEHLLRTAIREVSEETGFDVVLGRPLPPSVYEVGGGTKHVSFWAARCAQPTAFVPNDEVDDLAWLPVAAARERLSYERDIALLDQVLARPVQTAPLILLRHAEAGSKPESGADRAAAADLARPLDARGAADAETLARVLASYGRCQVISSAAERCLATVRPYAQAVRMQVQAEPALTVVPGPISAAALVAAATARDGSVVRDIHGAAARPGETPAAGQAATLAAELAASGEPTLVCAHRENLPAIIQAAVTALGASPLSGEPLGKSEFWVLHTADGRLIAAERHGLAALTSPSKRGPRLAPDCRRRAVKVWYPSSRRGRGPDR